VPEHEHRGTAALHRDSAHEWGLMWGLMPCALHRRRWRTRCEGCGDGAADRVGQCARSFIPLPNDLSFTFLVKVKDSAFYNYTDLNRNNLGKTLYFSNRRLSTETPGFPLINKAGDHFNINGTFALTPESAATEQIKLSSAEKINLFGLIKLYMKADIPALNIINPDGKIADPAKTFELVFANRKTFWRYIFRKDPKVKNNDDVKMEASDPMVLISKSELPLTHKGFISIELGGKDLPNPGSQLVKPDTLNTKYYSEIHM
jgi:hypothetical protein